MTTWPTAELHIHMEGTIEAELLIELARRNDVRLPSYDPEVLTARYDFADLQSFLDVHYSNLAVLRTEQDFHDLASAYLRRAANAGVRRAEIFFDPQTHLGNGVPFEAVIRGFDAAIAEATRSTGISADLILCFLRDLGADAAMETLEAALPFRDSFIGVGLDSTEVGYPPSLFTEVYARAAAEGLHRVAHAGEEGGPDYVREALDLLKVERIDHGNRALEDAELVRRLRDERIPLTVCPLSNVALRTAPRDLAQHPLRVMIDEGLLVSINSDDPAYFGGDVAENYRAIESALSLDAAQLATLARNSFESAFATDQEKATWIAEVDAELAKVTG
ncbi:adenosine deaminase [Agromyces sp. ISL-38]|uniref:adenosine deaminase n=1 Tax=Agromyces sp. ISL-38 TaxID=2819107 RepID=UPI001BE5DC9D|nr:adenosine deaminase [Agromyces sp. ISL-38]MBT2498235.1 adenosine deaminase [Agromyces sp. ISL-38]